MLASLTDEREDARLADRAASLQRTPSEVVATEDQLKPSDNLKDRKTIRDPGAPVNPIQGDVIAKVRQDLREAQRSRSLLEAKLQTLTEELNKLKVQSTLDSKRINDLTKEKAALTTGMRDRDEELRGKAKLLEVRDIVKPLCEVIAYVRKRMCMMSLCL